MPLTFLLPFSPLVSWELELRAELKLCSCIAARRFLYGMNVDQVFVKLDFSNAVNSIGMCIGICIYFQHIDNKQTVKFIPRDAVLEATAQFAPALVPYVTFSYGSPSIHE